MLLFATTEQNGRGFPANFHETTCRSRVRWIDGTQYLIKVRPIAIYNILCLPDDSFVDLDLKKLFQFLYDHCISDIVLDYDKFPSISAVQYNLSEFIDGSFSYDFYKARFICSTYTHHRLPDPIFNHVKPTNVHCFLVYLLLSMGEFSNEASLYKNAANMKECFVRAKLLRQYTDANPINEEDIYGIVRKYILQHILYVPDGTKSFGKYIVSSFQTLMSCFVYNVTPLNETPPYLNSQLVVKASDDLKKLLFKRKKTIVDILHSNLSNKLENIPPIESFLEASISNPMQWIPSLTQSDGQSYESVKEQKFAFTICMKTIHQYLNFSSTIVPKSVILCGTPGSGKTHLLRVLSLYCISKGLTTFITAAQSARAIVLGGVHLHKTFLFPFHHLTKNVYRSASLTIVQLNKNPLLLAALKRLDILFVDEIGQHAAEVWSIIDIVLRRIRSSHLYLGGVKTFSTMDLFQLPSFDGKPFLLNPYILTSYKICKLVHSVRARNDVKLQRLNELTRKIEYTNEELDEFESIIQNECQHVDSWDSEKITPFMIRIFGKKSAVKKAEKDYITEVKSRFSNSYVTRKCEDLETTQSEHGNWCEATPRTSLLLSREIKELEELILYPKAPIEFTYNKPGYWSQSQLGIVMNVPSQDDLDNWRSIAVYVSPPGTTDTPSFEITEENLLANNWVERSVGCAPERNHTLRCHLIAKRKQYGIVHRIAGTIHRLMGSDLSSIVTCIKRDENAYALWLNEQVVVLLSRTSFLKYMMFVGDKKETSQVLREIIQRKSPFIEYMNSIVENLHNESMKEYESNSMSTFVFDISQIPFQVSNFEIPSLHIPFVYVVVSLKDRKTCFISRSMNLRLSVRKNNEGFRIYNDSLDINLRPWALLCFMFGFDDDESEMINYCNALKSFCSKEKVMDKPLELIELAKEFIASYDVNSIGNLRFIQCLS